MKLPPVKGPASGQWRVLTVNGPALTSTNVPETPDAVKLSETSAAVQTDAAGLMTVTLPVHSVVAWFWGKQ